MTAVIQIRETECLAEGKWRVMLTCDSRLIKCTLTDPFSLSEKARLKWILEDYPTKFPFDLDRVEDIIGEIQQYAESIVKQLSLREFVKEALVSCQPCTNVLIEIVECATSSAFHSLHWELLEPWLDIAGAQSVEVRILVSRVVLSAQDNYANGTIQKPSPRGDQGKYGPKIQRKYNILLVISRPRQRRDDIDPLLGAKALNDIICELFSGSTDAPVNLEIVRPGSWKAFESYIRERTESWWRAGGHGSWFDVVHFDVHGVIHNGSPGLLFLSASGKTLLRSADLVAEVLVRHMVPFVVLHACESAKATTQRTNLAKILVEHGIVRVVAMSYKLTATAAQIFVRTFYHHLLAGTAKSPLPALHAARSVLFTNQVRIGKLDQEVVLPDYLVPVMYVSADDTAAHASSDDVLSMPLPQVKLPEASQSFGMSFVDPRLTHDVLGREQDILEMEWLLLREGHPNIASITGPVGVGKTTLVQFLGNWWKKTRLVSNFKYWSLKHHAPTTVIRYLRAWDASRPTHDSQYPRLFIIDDIAAVTGTGLDDVQKHHLTEILTRYRNRRDLVILVSRIPVDWLRLEDYQEYQLKGLSNSDALALASRILNEIGWGSFLEERGTLDQMECFASRMDFNPLSIDFFLRGSKDHVDWMQRSGLVASAEFTWDRPDNILPDNPERLLHFLLLACVNDLHESEGLPQCRESFDYIRALYDGDDTRAQLVLLSLLPFCGIYCEDWYMTARHFWITRPGSTWTVPGEHYFRQFVTEKLLGPGWAEHIGSIATDDGTQYRCIRIHPVFINSLRLMVMLSPNLKSLSEKLWLHFVVHETTWAYLRTDWARWREWRRQVQMRAISLLTACTLGFNLAVLNDGRIVQPYYVHIILNLLWFTAIGSSTPALTPAMLSLKMEQLLDFVEKRLIAGKKDVCNIHNTDHVGANIDVTLRTCDALSNHFHEKAHQKSADILKRLVKQVALAARRDENWDHNERRFSLARCLATFSYCSLRRNEFKRAKKLASLALRCHKSGVSAQERVRGIGLRMKSYYILWIAAIFSEGSSSTVEWYAQEAKAALDDRNKITDVDFADIRPQLQLVEDLDCVLSSGDQEVRKYLSETPEAAKIRRIVEQGNIDAAKTALYKGIEKAQKTGNTTAEGAFHADLAEICMMLKDWLGASKHIEQLYLLFKMKDCGPWSVPHHYDPSDMYDLLYRYARYGSVFLRLRMFLPAMLFCWRALEAVGAVDGPDGAECPLPNDPNLSVDFSMTILRANLCILVGQPRKLISPEEFNALDDLGQELVTSQVQKNWPEFDLVGKDIATRLRRAYDVLEAPEVGGPPPSQPKPHDVISLTAIVMDLSRGENGEPKLDLGFRERGLERQTEWYDEADDPDLNAVEDLVAFSRGIVRPENPR
ncbi:uncharacterized protein EI97DRAFT_469698 [Westerdykella ornata]|uniref:CHAT domain-containing protein n=1 Tax=Westerdykella ornata TaxID=318751 RepID=A0A6A6JDN5_WESOR|nr:uncharacterized protein EI97DRAFT_469698 [Westerdykella ornata]KAF2273299.1 hypothetical protein EI97DRAFT_469698 [Westerdykella ornata]